MHKHLILRPARVCSTESDESLHENTDLCNWKNISALFHNFQIPYPLRSHFLEHFVLQYVIKVGASSIRYFLELYNFLLSCFDVVEVVDWGKIQTIKLRILFFSWLIMCQENGLSTRGSKCFCTSLVSFFSLYFLDRVIVNLVSS